MVVLRKRGHLRENPAPPETRGIGRHAKARVLWPWRRQTWLLLAVTIGYVVAQLFAVRPGMPIGSDEAVYVTEVYPGIVPAGWGPQRARGVPWLISPATLFSPSITVIRIYLLLVLGLLMFIGFRAWLPVLGMRAVGASALFAAQWTTFFNGTQILPDLPVALSSIAAAGYLAQHLSARLDDQVRRRALWKAAAWVVAAAIFRPTDAIFLTVGLLAISLTSNLRLLLVRDAFLGAGLVVGWLPWAIEAQARFGGVLARTHAASSLARVTGSVHFATLHSYLTLALSAHPNPSRIDFDYLYWAILAAGIVIAVGRAAVSGDRTAAVAAIAGVVSGSQYLLFAPVVDPRYLLAAYGLVDITLVAVIPALPTLRMLRVSGWVATAAIFVAFAVYNFHSARVDGNAEYRGNSQYIQIAATLRKLAPNGPCFFASRYGHPEITFESGCVGAVISPWQDAIYLPELPGSHPVYMITRGGTYKIQPVPGSLHTLPRPVVPGWWIGVAPRGVTQHAVPTHFLQ